MKKRTSYAVFIETFVISFLSIITVLCVLLLVFYNTNEEKTQETDSEIPKITVQPATGGIMLVLVRKESLPEYFVFIDSSETGIGVTSFLSDNKLDEIYLNEGAEAVCKHLGRQDSGVCIMPFETIEKICNCLGGVIFDVENKMVQTDREEDLFIKINSGKQRLDGAVFCDYLAYSKDSDKRAARTTEIISLLLEQNKSKVDGEKLKELFFLTVNNSENNFSYRDFYGCIERILYSYKLSPVTANYNSACE